MTTVWTPNIIIITANFKSKDYLAVNSQLIKKHSPELSPLWVVIDNSPQRELINLNTTSAILDGCKYEDIPSNFVNKHSYHHAAALDKGIEFIQDEYTSNVRFVMFLDPDFFIFRDLKTILDYMIQKDLAAFGAPYYPIPGRPRIHGVPVAFNLIVDTTKIDISKWSFRPTGIEASGLVGDTGVNVYRDIQQNYKYEAVTPHSTGDSDKYTWQDKLYGIHYHAKLHLRKGPEELKQRIKGQLVTYLSPPKE